MSFPAPRSGAAWKWYINNVIGGQFKHHSQIMPGDIKVEDTNAFDDNPRSKPGVHILASVDERSYTPGTASMGADHPLIWWHCVGKGRALSSALGHAGMMYSEPLVIQFLDNAMSWGIAESGRARAAR